MMLATGQLLGAPRTVTYCIASCRNYDIVWKHYALSPVHTSNNVEATLSNATSWTILSTMSKQTEHVQFLSTSSKGRNFTIESFDIVAGVDGALVSDWTYITPRVFSGNEQLANLHTATCIAAHLRGLNASWLVARLSSMSNSWLYRCQQPCVC